MTGEVENVEAFVFVPLGYRVDGAAWRFIEMHPVGGRALEALIPGEALQGAWLEYFIEAQDESGETFHLLGSKADPVRVRLRGKGEAASREAPGLDPLRESGTVVDGAAGSRSEAATDDRDVVAVWTAEQWQALGIRRLVDLVKLLPGLETSRDVEGFWRVAAAGRRSDPELLVLWDGQRMNNPFDGRVIWEIPLDDLARVELRRGPGRATQAGAFTAVLDLVPRRDEGGRARVSAASFGGYEGAARYGLSFGRMRIQAAGDFATRQGYARAIERDVLMPASSDQPAGTTDDQRLGGGGRLRFDYAPSDDLTFFASGRMTGEDRGALVGLWNVVGPGSRLWWTQWAADAGVEKRGDSWRLSTRLFGELQQTDRTFTLIREPAVAQHTIADTRSLGGEALFAMSLPANHRLSASARGEWQTLAPFSFAIDGVSPADVVFPQADESLNGRLVGGAGIEDEWRPIDGLMVSGGLRFDGVLAGMDGLSAWALNPRAAVAYRVASPLWLKMQFGQSLRVPTFDELLSVAVDDPSLAAGKPLYGWDPQSPLAPVRLTTLALGAETSVPLDGGRLRLQSRGYWNEYANPIEGDGERWRNRTEGERVFGADLDARYETARRSSWFVNVAWQRTMDLEMLAKAPAFSLLTDVPQLRANLGGTLKLDRIGSLSLYAQFGAERRSSARNPFEVMRRYRIPAYGLLSATFRSRPLFDRFSAVATIVNLTDLDYRDDVPRPESGQMPGLLPREGVNGSVSLEAVF